jgi:hypothetical protein
MKILSYCRALLYTCAVLLCGLLRGAVGWVLLFFYNRMVCVSSIIVLGVFVGL